MLSLLINKKNSDMGTAHEKYELRSNKSPNTYCLYCKSYFTKLDKYIAHGYANTRITFDTNKMRDYWQINFQVNLFARNLIEIARRTFPYRRTRKATTHHGNSNYQQLKCHRQSKYYVHVPKSNPKLTLLHPLVGSYVTRVVIQQ